MDAEERLSPDELAEPTVLAAHHLHRYELAGALCAGKRVVDLGCGAGYGASVLAERGATSVVGVDVDEETVAFATQRYGSETVSFVTGDAVRYMDDLDPGEVDLVVAFESLEHLPDPAAAVKRLAALRERGVAVVVSAPNSRMFGEVNEFHVTHFDHDSFRALVSMIPEVMILTQHLAEGSVILGVGDTFHGPVAFEERGELEYANTFIAVSGVSPEQVHVAAARLNVVVAPNHNRFMIGLQRANAELRRANMVFGSGYLGRSDAGGASVIARLTQQVETQAAEIRAQRAHIAACDAKIHDLVDLAADFKYRWEQAEEAAKRRSPVVERFARVVARIPGARPVYRSLRRLVGGR